jgi:hypothetical protein
MNTNIPMGFQPTNVLAMMDAGTQAGARMGEVQQRGRLLNAYREHGAGVLSGDPNAMNALAAIDLPQAMDFRGQNQAYRINEETLQMRRAAGAREAQRFAAEMDAAEVAQTREMIDRGLATAIPALRSGDMETVNQIFRTAGLPAAETPQQAAEVIATYEGAMAFFDSSQEVLGVQRDSENYIKVTNVDGVLMQYDERDPAGTLTPLTEPRDSQGMSVTMNADGSFTVSEGGRTGGTSPQSGGLGFGDLGSSPGQFGGALLDIGSTPSGYATGVNDEGVLAQSALPGSPAAQEAEAVAAAAEQRQRNTEMSGTTVVQDLNRALDLIPRLSGLSTLPGVAGANARLAEAQVGGTVPNRIRQFTESALSNVGLDTLQRMREASPTGGALGQVPIQQQQRLEQVLGSLRLDQEITDLEANIQRVNNIYMDIIYGSSEERARLVDQGELSQEENAIIESAYYDLPFDRFGRPVGQQEPDTGAAAITEDDLSPEERALIGR